MLSYIYGGNLNECHSAFTFINEKSEWVEDIREKIDIRRGIGITCIKWDYGEFLGLSNTQSHSSIYFWLTHFGLSAGNSLESRSCQFLSPQLSHMFVQILFPCCVLRTHALSLHYSLINSIIFLFYCDCVFRLRLNDFWILIDNYAYASLVIVDWWSAWSG